MLLGALYSKDWATEYVMYYITFQWGMSEVWAHLGFEPRTSRTLGLKTLLDQQAHVPTGVLVSVHSYVL